MDTRMATCLTRTTRLLVLVLALLLTGHLAANPDGHHQTTRLPLAGAQHGQGAQAETLARGVAVVSLVADAIAAAHGEKDAHPRWYTAGQRERGIAPRQRLIGEAPTASRAFAGCHLSAVASGTGLERGSGLCRPPSRKWRAESQAAYSLTPSSLQIFRL
ncbi:hypothetical protein [Actinomadura sp. NPDC048394]|uniref:hypothetical protein n=1 Tax=Actinomadura sp. NPDC048394 TaxID=3158223 RepID=UPI00340AB39E